MSAPRPAAAGPAPTPDPEFMAALAGDLAAAGYTAEHLRERWGAAADGALGRGHALPARRALTAGALASGAPSSGADADDPLAVIALLFGLGQPAPLDAVASAFPRTGVGGLENLNLIRSRATGIVHPLVLLRPQSFIDDEGAGQWWIASDLDEAALGGALPEDHVLGVGGASLTLAGLQLTSPVARVLDLGSGCGIQALRALRVADRVVATDRSERALAFTRFNDVLNTVLNNEAGSASDARIQTRAGDLFDPVRGDLFDRVVSNPPFVITPREGGVPAYEYRDGGRVGDALVAEVVSGVGTVLVPGGTAQLLGNWESRDGVDGLDRVRAWVAQSPVPMDAWVIERERMDPVSYAELWIRDGGTVPGTPEYDRLLGAWLDDFAARGVSAIGFGYVLLRRAVGTPTLARYERVTHAVPESGLGEALTRALAAHDTLQNLDDRALGTQALVVAPDVTEARHFLPGADDPSVIELRQGGGFARTIAVDPALAALVGACDGELTVGQIIAAIAELMDADEQALHAELLPHVRALVVDGFLALP